MNSFVDIVTLSLYSIYSIFFQSLREIQRFLWNFIFSLLMIYYLQAPTLFGGHENLPKEDICASILHLPSHHFYNDIGMNMCQTKLDNIITSWTTVFFTIALVLSLQHSISFYQYISRKSKKQSPETIKQAKDTKKYRDRCVLAVEQIIHVCRQENLSNKKKLNDVQRAIRGVSSHKYLLPS